MQKLVVAKFGGSAVGIDGEGIPAIIERINELKKESKIIAVFSAPMTLDNGKRRSLTDVVIELGKKAEKGEGYNLDLVKSCYNKILLTLNPEIQIECKKIIESYLQKTQDSLSMAASKSEFVDETRSKALAFSGEVLMGHVMSYVMKNNGIRCSSISLEQWPIITDKNIESTNFLPQESRQALEPMEKLVEENDVVSIGGFIGKTPDGVITTYERGGSDRTAADLGILFHKKYETRVDFEKDSAVVSADPKVVKKDLAEVKELSYNEARLAGMFGMKILDPIAIKEILENGVDMPIIVTNMERPEDITTIKRVTELSNGHPIKIVTGKKNCAIVRIENDAANRLLSALETEKRYGEFVILSPFTKDGMSFTRILFLDGDYVKRNEKFILAFDSLATIEYNRGVITLIGDEMWRVQKVVSRTSFRIGEAGLNILNMDAQEETSRIIIVLEDSGDNIENAIKVVHDEKSKISFV